MPNNNFKDFVNNATDSIKDAKKTGIMNDIADSFGNRNEDELNDPELNLQPGDKVAPGKEIGKDGKIKETSTQRLQNVVARGVTAYATGGSEKADMVAKKISQSRLGNAVSEQLDNNKLVSEGAKILEEEGVTDTAEGTLDAAASALRGDVSGTVEGVKKAAEGATKFRKNLIKRYIIIGLIIFSFVFLIFFVIVAPFLSGFMELSDSFDWSFDNPNQEIVDPDPGSGDGSVIPIPNIPDELKWNGDLSEIGRLISEMMKKGLFPEGLSGWCAQWVKNAFLTAGIPFVSMGDAHNYYNTVSGTDYSKLEPGMIIVTPYSKKKECNGNTVMCGHIGLVFQDTDGTLKVADARDNNNLGQSMGSGIQKTDVSAWSYSFCTKHGYECHFGYPRTS